MKVNKIFCGITAACLMGLSSCTLDYDPVDTYSDVTEGVTETGKEAVFKDKAAVESFLTGLYKLMKDRQEHWYMDLLMMVDTRSDNAYAGSTGAEVVPFETNAIDGANSVLTGDWNRYLEDLAKSNLLIQFIDEVKDPALTQAEVKVIKAQAKIFRAMVLFDMVRFWGDIPLVTTIGEDITAENIETVYEQYFPGQAKEEEVYKQIEQDLLEALPDAPNNNPSDKTRFSKSVARALLAKMYAEKPLQDYSKVIKYADELENDGFDLVPFEDIFGVNEDRTDIKMRNTKESVLEAQFSTGNGNWCTWMFGRDLSNWDNMFSWAKWLTPSRDLIAAYEEAGDVVRYKETIVYYECGWSNYYPSDNYPFMYKCRSAYNSLIKFRFADVLLLKAEALIYGANPDLEGAAKIIDRIRERAGLRPLTAAVRSNRQALEEAYLNERRLELAFEGERWFDLARLDKLETVMNAVYAKDKGRLRQVHPFTKDSYRYPIPQAVIDTNGKIKQNPGY